jgi:hypothetical protein
MEISCFCGFFLISVVKFSFLVVDDGKDLYTHHLPAGWATHCVLGSALVWVAGWLCKQPQAPMVLAYNLAKNESDCR